MASSVRLVALKQEIKRLRLFLLPKDFDPTGTYTDRQQTRALGFRVLVHAEIEAYLEDRATDLAKKAVEEWKVKGRMTRTIMCLSSFVQDDPPTTLESTQASQKKLWPEKIDITVRLEAALSKFFHRVSANHGLKEEHVLSLLLPVGVPPTAIDPFLIIALTSFGERRGQVAHTSAASYRAQAAINAQSEWNDVQHILNLLQPLDEAISKLYP